ncbi:serine/threonine protein kinase [Streptomyces ipomoeae]|nr:serine/threonine-protein kinase [Streptomyces ipomoeae]TQE38468.1 serine/threonine protein kinase [Streptomyces ipomoeae]
MVTGRYRLVESIGQGGMGRVWRATDEILDRQVAVKEMRIDGLDPEDTRTRRERTLREARASARIDHPGVVRVYDVVDEGERLWIVMELIDGRSLERLLVDDGPLDVRETARIGLELVDALGQVHAQGVLHRDIKPANVLVRRSGTHRVVLTDFGIAAIQDAEALTMVGMLVGSPDYMAPERVSGRPQGPPSDLWSLGATLCAALGGRSPFSRSTTLATLHAVLYEEPELPPTAGELHDLLAALLKKDPEARPGLRELTEALRTIATGPIGGAVAAPVEPEPSGAGEEPDSGEAEIAGQAAETAGAGEPEASSAPHPEPLAAAPESAQGSAPSAGPTPVRRTPTLRNRPEPPSDPRSAPDDPRSAPERGPGATPVPSPEPSTPQPDRPTTPVRNRTPGVPPPSNASSEAPPTTGTPELPSEGAPATPNAWRSGIQVEHPEPNPAEAGAPAGPAGPAAPVGQRTPTAQPTPLSPGAPEGGHLPTQPRPTPTPPGEPLGPAVAAGSAGSAKWWRGKRRTALITAVGLAVAGVVAAVVVPALGGSPDDKDEASPSTSPSSSAPTVAGTSRPPSSPPSLPPGSRSEAGVFAWIPPDGFSREVHSGAEVHYTSPDARQEIVGKASLARGDLLEQWRKKEESTSEGPDYRRIRLEETEFRGRPAVVWEYTVTAQELPWHVRSLGFDADGKSYQLTTWYHPDIEARALPIYEKVEKSFTPL